MKRFLSLFLSLVMLFSITAGMEISAYADYASSAQNLELNGSWTVDYTTETVKEHYYRVYVSSEGNIILKGMSYTGYTHVEFYNNDLSNKIDYMDVYGSKTEPQTKTMDLSISAGTYFIKVSGYTGEYRLCATFESYNTNYYAANSFDSPYDLSANYQLTGAITETDKVDYLRLNVPYTGYYIVKATSYTGYTCVEFYNNDLSNKIDYMDVYGSKTEPQTKTMNLTLNAGTYYIKVTGYTGKYYLIWSALTQDNCSHSFESSTVYPTYVAKGYTLHTCRNCGYSYKDNYTSKYKLSAPSFYTDSKGGKKSLKLYYSSVYNATGYQIQYSTDKKFKKNVKTVNTKKNKKNISKLKSKKKYYVRVRAYVKQNGKTAYSSWSSKKAIKTK